MQTKEASITQKDIEEHQLVDEDKAILLLIERGLTPKMGAKTPELAGDVTNSNCKNQLYCYYCFVGTVKVQNELYP